VPVGKAYKPQRNWCQSCHIRFANQALYQEHIRQCNPRRAGSRTAREPMRSCLKISRAGLKPHIQDEEKHHNRAHTEGSRDGGGTATQGIPVFPPKGRAFRDRQAVRTLGVRVEPPIVMEDQPRNVSNAAVQTSPRGGPIRSRGDGG